MAAELSDATKFSNGCHSFAVVLPDAAFDPVRSTACSPALANRCKRRTACARRVTVFCRVSFAFAALLFLFYCVCAHVRSRE